MTATAVLVTSHRKAAHYLPLVREALDAFWPNRPPVRFISDGGVEPAADVFLEPEPRFVPLLANGLARLRAEFPDVTHIIHMLDDHCPLRPCDFDRISAVVSNAIEQDLAAVSFPTYSWPWDNTETTEYADGLVRTWRRIDTVKIAGETFARVPMDFFRYFQVQPTIWRVSYLDNACAVACAAGVFDPWGFEALRLPSSEQHYISRYSWPTVHHGFLAKGAINPAAIDYVDKSAGHSIRHRFIRDAVGIDSEAIYHLHQLRRLASRYVSRVMEMLK